MEAGDEPTGAVEEALTANLFTNPNFGGTLNGWNVWTPDPSPAAGDENAIVPGASLATFKMRSAGDPWSAILFQRINVKAGERFAMSFDLTGTGEGARSAVLHVIEDTNDFTAYGTKTCTVPSTGTVHCSLTATVTESTVVSFGVEGGNSLADFSVKNAVLTRVNLLVNPSFTSNLSGWSQYVANAEDKIGWVSAGGDGMGSSARFYTDGQVNQPWDVHLEQSVSVVANQRYTWSFDVATTSGNARNVSLAMYQLKNGVYNNFVSSSCAVPGTGTARCTLTGLPAGTGPLTVAIDGGDNLNDFTVDNATLFPY